MSITRAMQRSHLSTRTRAVLCYGLGRTRTSIFQVCLFFLRVPVGEMIFDALAAGLRCSLSLGSAQLITRWRELWHRADKALIISNKPICQAEVVPASSVLAHVLRSHRGKGRWMTGKQIPSLFPWLREVLSGVVVWKEKEHTLDQICEMGAMCLAAAGWSHLPAPHKNCRVTVSSLLSLPLCDLLLPGGCACGGGINLTKKREGNLHSFPFWLIECSFPVHC